MTTPTANSTQSHIQGSAQLAETFAEALTKAISAQSGKAWSSRVSSEQPQRASEDPAPLAVELQLTGKLGGKVCLALEAAASAELLSTLEATAPQDAAQAWLTLCTAAKEIFLEGSHPAFEPLAIDTCELVPAIPDSQPLAQVELKAPGGTVGALIRLTADAALNTTLARLDGVSRKGTPAAREANEGTGPQIERVIDVPLAVTLRFGQRHLTLREVLALSAGSLVELDRQVEEPVELVLGDRLIARGDVVIVDGNYGLRVTEVIEGATQGIRRLHTVSTPAATHAPEETTA